MTIALVAGSKNRSDTYWGNTYTNSVSCAFAADVAAGNLLVAIIDHGDHDSATDSLTGVTDNIGGGQTWAKAASYWDTATHQGYAIYYKYNTAASSGNRTVTASFSTSTANWITLSIYEFNGVLSTSDPLDQKTSAAGNGSATPSIGPITPSQNGELIVAGCVDDSGATTTLTINSPFSELSHLAAGDTCGYYVQPTTAPITIGFTGNAASPVSFMSAATFKAAASGGTTYNKSVTGSFPAPSGSPTKRVFKVLAGSVPAPGGVITRKTNKGVTGVLPAPGGAFASRSVGKGVSGSLPSPAGTASSNGAFGEALSGNFPAPSGSITKRTGKMLTGTVPAASGSALKLTSRLLTGNMPAASGDTGHGAILHQSVAGIMGAITGAVATVLNPVVAAAKGLLKIIGSGFKKIIGG